MSKILDLEPGCVMIDFMSDFMTTGWLNAEFCGTELSLIATFYFCAALLSFLINVDFKYRTNASSTNFHD